MELYGRVWTRWLSHGYDLTWRHGWPDLGYSRVKSMLRSVGFFVLTLSLTLGSVRGALPVYQQSTVYVCPMHPEVQSSKPGECPKCGMQLVVKSAAPANPDSDKSGGATVIVPNPGQTPVSSQSVDAYTCPMHPEIRLNAPGKCPKCGMTL